MAQKIKFDPPPRPVAGLTPFGTYDADPKFKAEAPKLAMWIARRLGWPTVDIEISDADMYAAFEEAIDQYSSLVNEYNIRENLYTLRGTSVSENVTGRYVAGSPVPFLVKLARSYGSMVRAGGYVKYRKDFITVSPNPDTNEFVPREFIIDSQTYDLAGYMEWKIGERINLLEARLGVATDQEEIDWLESELAAYSKHSGSNIIIKKIYHYRVPYSAYGVYQEPARFGVTHSFPAGLAAPGYFWDPVDLADTTLSQYAIMPVSTELLRQQALEFGDMVRKSHYTFELVGGRVKLFPIPRATSRLWFEYVFEDEFQGGEVEGIVPEVGTEVSENEVVTDISNVPYDVIPYNRLNAPARRWIYRYALAIAKHKLGTVRSKFDSVPTPLDTFRLDGESLKAEANDELNGLMDSLRETLEAMSRSEQMSRQTEEAEQLQQFLTKVPTRLYIG